MHRKRIVIKSRGMICRSEPEVFCLLTLSDNANSRVRTPLVSVGIASVRLSMDKPELRRVEDRVDTVSGNR